MTKIEKFTKWLKCEVKLIELSKGYGDDWVRRELYVDDKNKPTYKFMEKIVFHNSINLRCAICIGLNPADASDEIDESNKRLIRKLKQSYNGYYLFNLFPQIASEPSSLDMSNTENKTFITKLIKILNHKQNKKADIILFWGRTQEIPVEFVNFLKRHTKRHIYLTCYNDDFTHPGVKNSNIELKAFALKYLRTRIQINDNP